MTQPSIDAPAAPPSKHHEAQERGFVECVHALQGTLRAAPVGWALVAWLVHGPAPYRDVLIWAGIAGLVWALNLLILRNIERAGASIGRHRTHLLTIAVLDGVSWGLVVLLLMTHDRDIDAWLAVVLCGVVSVNAPTYISYLPAFRALVGALWLTAAAAAAYLLPHFPAAPQLVLGLLVYFGLLVHSARPMSIRVIDGIRLQLENAALAEQLQEALQHMEHQATTDALTGQMNRRALDALLLRAVKEATQRGFQFSVLMLDIDHFKLINDTHGHNVGDQALRGVAQRVAAQLRGVDSCARFGGEEFVIVLPGVSLAQACEVGERIRRALADMPLPTQPPLVATASIGAAQYRVGMAVEALLAAADAAVYVAKRNGRNQVRPAEQGISPAAD